MPSNAVSTRRTPTPVSCPSPGRITALRVAGGPGVRDDSGAEAGDEVPIYYDPMLSKLVAWAEDRPRAIARMQRALDEYVVDGIKTTVPFFRWIVREPAFIEAQFHTAYLDELLHQRAGKPFSTPDASLEEVAAVAAALYMADARLKPGPTSDVAPGFSWASDDVRLKPHATWRRRGREENLRA